MISLLLLLSTSYLCSGPISACHRAPYQFADRARARAERTSVVGDASQLTAFSTEADYDSQPDIDPCRGINYVPFTAVEMRTTAAVSYLADEPHLSIAEGGRVTCSFDNEQEYCSWYNVHMGLLRFWRARYEIPFDLQRFQCTSERDFQFDDYFLMGGGEYTMGVQKIAIETEIQCQYEDAVLKFDFWTNSDRPIVRQCIIQENLDMDCQDILPMPNPMNFTIPQSVEPFKIRIEIVNIDSSSIVLLDNLYYEGRICEVVDDYDDDLELTTPPTVETQDTNSEQFFLGNRAFSPNLFVPQQQSNNFVESPSPQFEQPPPPSQVVHLADPSPVKELSVCESLVCDFNGQHSCFYGLSGIGSTSPWTLGHHLVGNRHTGIQRINLRDASEVGFIFVGEDQKSHEDDLYVIESPKFNLEQNVYLVFDFYLRSKGPKLKVCLDSFDYCPYRSPPVDPDLFWHESQRVFVPPGVKKIYFIATDVASNLFLAIDNIRLESEDGSDPCL